MSELHNALADLKLLPRLLERYTVRIVQQRNVEYFSNIKQLIVKLESEVSGAFVPRPIPPEYREQWNNYLQNENFKIDLVALWALCREVDIVHDPKFAKYLFRNVDVAKAKVIKGLVWSLHQKWGGIAQKTEITGYIAKQLSAYSGSDRVLLKWKGDVITVIGENGSAYFAKKNLLVDFKSPKVASKEWFLSEFSEYISSAVAYAMDVCIEKVTSSSDIIDYLFDKLFIWTGWESNRNVLDATVKKLLLHPDVFEFKDRLRSAILSHPLLGDPRLPANRNKWVGVDPSACQRFIQWISADDILFFFDYILKKQDPHQRRSFWLKNITSYNFTGCRCLLSEAAANELRGNKDIRFGRLSDTQNKAAFILDFGKLVAVEFSGVGCVYLFKREEFDKSIHDMWADHPIREGILKNQFLPKSRRVPHNLSWQGKVVNVFARYEIWL